MIVDYEIDFQYLVDVVRTSTPLDLRCQCAFRLLEIACCENGRFVVKANSDDDAILRTGLMHDSESDCGVSLFDIKKDCILSEYYIGLFLPYGVISERPCKRVLSEGEDDCGFRYCIGNAAHQVGLVQYFQGEDSKRRSYLGKQSFYQSGVRAQAINFSGFDVQLKMFAAAEEVGFVIVDPYCMGGRIENANNFLDLKVKVLLGWVYHLARQGVRPLRFDIYTSCPYKELPRGRDYEGGMMDMLMEDDEGRSLLLRKVQGGWENRRLHDKKRTDVWPILICFHLIKDGNWLIHDRFVGSSTHYFSMGRGLDGVCASRDENVAYNIYYCGKKNIREEQDMKRILDYVKDRNETPEITIVECPLDGYREV